MRPQNGNCLKNDGIPLPYATKAIQNHHSRKFTAIYSVFKVPIVKRIKYKSPFDYLIIVFAKDVYKVICDLFKVYHMNRISWSAYADNPAIRGYRNFIKKYGGRECGYRRQRVKLMDGKLHDSVEFEILAEEFKL